MPPRMTMLTPPHPSGTSCPDYAVSLSCPCPHHVTPTCLAVTLPPFPVSPTLFVHMPPICHTSPVPVVASIARPHHITCNACDHPSDTFDAILDLSLDIQSVGSIQQALAK